VTERKVRDFEETFGPEGVWVELLSRSDGYRKTGVERESGSRFRVTDYWDSHLDFEAFRRLFAADVKKFARLLEDVVESELLLGVFYEDQPGEDNGDDLVPA
jgi:hypothetical protein